MKTGSIEWWSVLSLPLLFLAVNIDGKIFTKCELARELERLRVPREDIPKWVTIASPQFKTDRVNSPAGSKFGYYGIFQIGEEYWCKSSKGTINACKVNCDDLLKDDLVDSVKCVRTILNEHGWSAWPNPKILIDVSECFEDRASTIVNRTITTTGQTDEASVNSMQSTLSSFPSGVNTFTSDKDECW